MHYTAFCGNYHHTDIGNYTSYGIKFERSDCQHCIHDISVNEQIVKNMADLFNQYELEPEHFQDAVEDMLIQCGSI